MFKKIISFLAFSFLYTPAVTADATSLDWQLAKAVIKGNPKVVEQCLKYGAHVNAVVNGEPILIQAVREIAKEADGYYGMAGRNVAKDIGIAAGFFILSKAVGRVVVRLVLGPRSGQLLEGMGLNPAAVAYRSMGPSGNVFILADICAFLYCSYRLTVSIGTFLEQTFKNYRMRVLTLLLEHPKTNLNITNAAGQTALAVAQEYIVKNPNNGCLMRSMERVKALLEKNNQPAAGAVK